MRVRRHSYDGATHHGSTYYCSTYYGFTYYDSKNHGPIYYCYTYQDEPVRGHHLLVDNDSVYATADRSGI